MTRYWTRTLLGLGIACAAVVAFDWGLYHVVRIGSCGSDGTYVAVRPCPPGTGKYILALIGGVFAGLIGVFVYATRGEGGRPSPVPLGAIMWMLLFVGIPVCIGVSAWGPAAGKESEGAGTLAIVMGVFFVPMGLAPLALLRGGRGKQAKLKRLATLGKRAEGHVLSVEDTGVTINDNPRVKITVRAEPQGDAPFTIVKTATVSRVSIPRPGDRCTVMYDPANREQENAITFNAPVWTPQPVAAAADADDGDPLEKIARLGELRAKGLLTDEEFEAQKRRLLDEV